ncbi:MAG: hypothetical protein ABL982_10690 [Vicinamibacterales bacterium]
MSRIKSDSPVFAASKAVRLLPGRDAIEASAEQFEYLAKARQFVPAILATGLFGGPDGMEFQIVEAIARLRADLLNIESIEAERDRLLASEDVEQARRELHELCYHGFMSGAEAGYLLGLAVGQALGPDALKGGAK